MSVFIRDDEKRIIAGLTGKTYREYLEIQFLWVDERSRKGGLASSLMAAAESQALQRGCKRAFLDTLSFQAPGFYKKLGYTEFGRLCGFSGQHERHFLRQQLEPTPR
ncbi:GNAT family N-acetyltransferase [Paraburkholderia sp. GAS334]|uniref:GNAT family N-acetyltransferase n=1 Tax=unclassified Paraburkholderia TaxID=2615204 RepID=UPI003D1B19B4